MKIWEIFNHSALPYYDFDALKRIYEVANDIHCISKESFIKILLQEDYEVKEVEYLPDGFVRKRKKILVWAEVKSLPFIPKEYQGRGIKKK